ncbi:hypothetical protein AB0L71_21210 [Streptomyces sp. NPDC052052]|uniref:hypothetical protein n=1 Tax=Streptomyces sp. NPDC052052 TaxID=3154756 RepID=UPI0034358258
MSTLQVILGILCLLLTAKIVVASKGTSDRTLRAAAAVLLVGGFAIPAAFPTAGWRLLSTVCSLVVLLFIAQQQRRKS